MVTTLRLQLMWYIAPDLSDEDGEGAVGHGVGWWRGCGWSRPPRQSPRPGPVACGSQKPASLQFRHV